MSDKMISCKLWSEANLVNFLPFFGSFSGYQNFSWTRDSWHFIADDLLTSSKKSEKHDKPIHCKTWFRVDLVLSGRLWTNFTVIQTLHQKWTLLLFTNNVSLNFMQMQKLRKIWDVNHWEMPILSKFEPFLSHLASPKFFIINILVI